MDYPFFTKESKTKIRQYNVRELLVHTQKMIANTLLEFNVKRFKIINPKNFFDVCLTKVFLIETSFVLEL